MIRRCSQFNSCADRLRRKSAKVVDSSRGGGDCDPGFRNEPVVRDRKDGRGLGVSCPIRRHASAYPLLAIAFIGLPWPKKMAGSLLGMLCSFYVTGFVDACTMPAS